MNNKENKEEEEIDEETWKILNKRFLRLLERLTKNLKIYQIIL